jgi:hypothetical protein
MTITLYNVKKGIKEEVDENQTIDQAAMELGLGSVTAKKAKFFAPGNRELEVNQQIKNFNINEKNSMYFSAGAPLRNRASSQAMSSMSTFERKERWNPNATKNIWQQNITPTISSPSDIIQYNL